MRSYRGLEGIDCCRECEQPCVVVHWQLRLRKRCCSEVYTCVGMDPGHRTCRLQHGCTFWGVLQYGWCQQLQDVGAQSASCTEPDAAEACACMARISRVAFMRALMKLLNPGAWPEHFIPWKVCYHMHACAVLH